MIRCNLLILKAFDSIETVWHKRSSVNGIQLTGRNNRFYLVAGYQMTGLVRVRMAFSKRVAWVNYNRAPSVSFWQVN